MPQERTQEQVIDLIRKLLAMTESAGCTQAEAANAMARAMKLQEEYHLDLASVKRSGVNASIILRTYPYGADDYWLHNAMKLIAEHTFCREIGRWGQSYAEVIGEQTNMDICFAMYEFVIGQMKRLGGRGYSAEILKGSRIPRDEFNRAFYGAMLRVVRERMEAQQTEFEVDPSAMALVVDVDSQLDEVQYEMYPTSRPGYWAEQEAKNRAEHPEWYSKPVANDAYDPDDIRTLHTRRAKKEYRDNPNRQREYASAYWAGNAAGHEILIQNEVS